MQGSDFSGKKLYPAFLTLITLINSELITPLAFETLSSRCPVTMCRPCPSFTRLFARGAALGSPLHPVSSHLLLNLLSSTLANMLITHDPSNVHLYVEFPSCMSHGLLEFNISQIPLIFFPSKPVPTSIFCFS